MPIDFRFDRGVLLAMMIAVPGGLSTGCDQPTPNALRAPSSTSSVAAAGESPENAAGRHPTAARGEAGRADREDLADAASAVVIGPSCVSKDPDQLCLGLKYVVYQENGKALATESNIAANLEYVNESWAACGIQFQIERHEVVRPRDFGLAEGAAARWQLDRIRDTFADPARMLVVQVNEWGTDADAWTSLPGHGSYGVILDGDVASYAPVLAHELGHYLNLAGHPADRGNLMNATVYTNGLYSSQCAQARQSARGFWRASLRY